ncbi:hypothetical protein NC653_012493 [Populus alba x Populus x berolinensis]|uniref:Uncharacterized protein n=1 Tax=Populus alba x Populus x berolinensis TaxID=444605 RepID=A0AAD6QT12_9ROSI|nr:hypothetical protein NC653_012493 [Populus alba x Populus x berolinensis]
MDSPPFVMGKITLELKHYKGSVSVLGTANDIKVIDLPVVGGTEPPEAAETLLKEFPWFYMLSRNCYQRCWDPPK